MTELSELLIYQHQKVAQERQDALRPTAEKLLVALEAGASEAVIRGFLEEIPEGGVEDEGRYPYNLIGDEVVRKRMATLMDLEIGEPIVRAYLTR